MKRKGTATHTTLNKIIHEAIPKAASTAPFLYQEPFLETRLVNILSNIKQNNPLCSTVLYSNLNVLPEQAMQDILRFNLLDELHISFYGPTEELYKKWQPPLNRSKTVENIKRFHTARGTKHKPTITLHVLNVPEILAAINGYKDVIKYVDQTAIVQYDTFHGAIPDLAGDQSKVLGVPAKRTPCQRLWTSLTVHYDGSVVPCCLDFNDEYVLGNVNTESLETIWDGQKFRELRDKHQKREYNKIELCKNCRVHQYQFSKEWVEWWSK